MTTAAAQPAVPSGSKARAFPAGAEVQLFWSLTLGSRLSGQGFSADERELGVAVADRAGCFTVELDTPHDHGGLHTVTARSGAEEASLSYVVTPELISAPTEPVAPGGDVVIQLSGVGWSETETIYTFVLDNGYVGYACGVHSGGDVTVTLKAPGQSGMHYLPLYPTIYYGEMNGPGTPPAGASTSQNYFLLPMLNPEDNPGGNPVISVAFEVR